MIFGSKVNEKSGKATSGNPDGISPIVATGKLKATDIKLPPSSARRGEGMILVILAGEPKTIAIVTKASTTLYISKFVKELGRRSTASKGELTLAAPSRG